jgi:hypothetical protein
MIIRDKYTPQQSSLYRDHMYLNIRDKYMYTRAVLSIQGPNENEYQGQIYTRATSYRGSTNI